MSPITVDQVKTGYVLFYKGHTFLSKSIEYFMKLFGIKHKISVKWIPSHMGTSFIEDDLVKIGESVWPRYKINDFNSNYQKNFIIMKPKEDFTSEEQEIGKKYILELSAKGGYQWWKYPAYIWYVWTGRKELFNKKQSDWNTVCYESSTRVIIKMRSSLMPENYNTEEAICFDVLDNSKFEILIDKR